MMTERIFSGAILGDTSPSKALNKFVLDFDMLLTLETRPLASNAKFRTF